MARRERRGRRIPAADDEPVIDGADVEWCGDQLIDRMRSLLRRLH